MKLPCFLLLSVEIHGACTAPDQCIDDKIPCCRAGKKCLAQERGRVSSERSSAAVPAGGVYAPAPHPFPGLSASLSTGGNRLPLQRGALLETGL